MTPFQKKYKEDGKAEVLYSGPVQYFAGKQKYCKEASWASDLVQQLMSINMLIYYMNGHFSTFTSINKARRIFSKFNRQIKLVYCE